MSQAFPSVPSCSNYQVIFDSALEAYQRKTGKDLTSDPLLRSLENCQSPDAILAILQAQILDPAQPQSSRNKLTTWLDPTVIVLNAFSETIGGFVGLVSLNGSRDTPRIYSLILILEAYPPSRVIFTGIGALLSVSILIDLSFRANVPRPNISGRSGYER
jgi:hypothetical protein